MKHPLPKRPFLQLLRSLKEGFLELVCPEKTYTFGSPTAELRAMVVVHDERFFRRALFGADIGMGEAFMDGDWSSPDLVSLIRLAVRNLGPMESSNKLSSALSSVADTVAHRLRGNTLSGSRRNISYHYDLGNDFYRLFLDPTMAYSCAYYQTTNDSLEQAQLNKFERICRKLELKPTDHLLEIGTGWGGFAAYAATHYGCRITTTTISRQQHDYAENLFANLGQPGERITLLLEDYRKLRGQFDKIVSIEMFEAVGLGYYDTYFGACDRLLKPEGMMVLQTITMNEQKFPVYRKRCDWIQKYIFPGSALASVAEIGKSLGRSTKLSLFHLEDIGLHYAETLKLWRGRFLLNIDKVKAQGFDERFLRMWEYYLCYCEGAFRERHIGDVQLVLTRQRAPVQLVSCDQYTVPASGFGVMGWVAASDYSAAQSDPLAEHKRDIMQHMNADHKDALVLLAKRFAGIEAMEAAMTSVDRLGFNVRLKAQDGVHGARIAFLREVTNPTQTREVFVEMVKQARQE